MEQERRREPLPPHPRGIDQHWSSSGAVVVSRGQHYCSARRALLLHPRSNSDAEHIPIGHHPHPSDRSRSYPHSTHSIPAEAGSTASRANINLYTPPEGSLPSLPASSIFGKTFLCARHMSRGCAQKVLILPARKSNFVPQFALITK